MSIFLVIQLYTSRIQFEFIKEVGIEALKRGRINQGWILDILIGGGVTYKLYNYSLIIINKTYSYF